MQPAAGPCLVNQVEVIIKGIPETRKRRTCHIPPFAIRNSPGLTGYTSFRLRRGHHRPSLQDINAANREHSRLGSGMLAVWGTSAAQTA